MGGLFVQVLKCEQKKKKKTKNMKTLGMKRKAIQPSQRALRADTNLLCGASIHTALTLTLLRVQAMAGLGVTVIWEAVN